MKSPNRVPSLIPLLFTSVLGLVLVACSAADVNDDALGEISSETTVAGTATEGAACRVAPILRKDKCVPALKCATTSASAATGTCVKRHAESESCDPALGSAGCQVGLSCVPRVGGAGGFCKGPGTGACRTENNGADCALGRVCKAKPSTPGAGACVLSGGEGTPCTATLVNNECLTGFECVVPYAKTDPSKGICTNVLAGGLGADCASATSGQWSTTYMPDPSKCAEGYACAVDPALIGGWAQSADLWRFRCTVHSNRGERCVGIGYSSNGALEDFGQCSSPEQCFWASGPVEPTRVASGMCASPLNVLGAACGQYGVDECGWSNGDRLWCIGGSCVTSARSPGAACVSGGAPGAPGTTSNCGGGRRCIQGHCQ